MSALQILLVVAVVGWMIIRRFAGSPVAGASVAAPIALTAYGIYELDHGLHRTFHAADIGLLAIEAIIGLVAGLGRGATIKLFARDGHLWQRYTVLTLAVWIAMIAV